MRSTGMPLSLSARCVITTSAGLSSTSKIACTGFIALACLSLPGTQGDLDLRGRIGPTQTPHLLHKGVKTVESLFGRSRGDAPVEAPGVGDEPARPGRAA